MRKQIFSVGVLVLLAAVASGCGAASTTDAERNVRGTIGGGMILSRPIGVDIYDGAYYAVCSVEGQVGFARVEVAPSGAVRDVNLDIVSGTACGEKLRKVEMGDQLEPLIKKVLEAQSLDDAQSAARVAKRVVENLQSVSR